MENIAKAVEKEVGGLLPEVYKDLLQPSVKQLGIALGGITEFALAPTLPFLFANAKLRQIFERNIKKLNETTAKIPVENTVEVPPELSVPLLQKIAYASNSEVAELYINLLTSASNVDTASQAHPAFISMIERMSVDEAQIIEYLCGQNSFGYSYLRIFSDSNLLGFGDVLMYSTEFKNYGLAFPQNLPIYFSNLISMGILVDDKSVQILNTDIYETIHNLYIDEYNAIVEKYKETYPTCVPQWLDARFNITPFGHLFIKACTLNRRVIRVSFIKDRKNT